MNEIVNFSLDISFLNNYSFKKTAIEEWNLSEPSEKNTLIEDLKDVIKTEVSSAVKGAITKESRGITTKNTFVDLALIVALVLAPLYYAVGKIHKLDTKRLTNAAAITYQSQNQEEFDRLVNRALTLAQKNYKPNLMIGDEFVAKSARDELAEMHKEIIGMLGKEDDIRPNETAEYFLFMGLYYCGTNSEEIDTPGMAKKYFEKYLGIVPDDEQVLVNLGVLHSVAHGNYKAALENYNEALEYAPGDCRAHYNKALTLMSLGLQKEAIKEINELVRRRPDCPESLFAFGLINFQIGDWEKADECLRKAADQGFNDINWLVKTGHISNDYRKKSSAYKYAVTKIGERLYLKKETIQDLINLKKKIEF